MGRALRPWVSFALLLIGLFLIMALVYVLVVLWHEGVVDATAVSMGRAELIGCAVGVVALLASAVLFVTGRK